MIFSKYHINLNGEIMHSLRNKAVTSYSSGLYNLASPVSDSWGEGQDGPAQGALRVPAHNTAKEQAEISFGMCGVMLSGVRVWKEPESDL